jgi:hypothetical protein
VAQPGFRFHGTDVVCSLIEQHRTTFANVSGSWAFDCVDYAAQPLPTGYEVQRGTANRSHHAIVLLLCAYLRAHTRLPANTCTVLLFILAEPPSIQHSQ